MIKINKSQIISVVVTALVVRGIDQYPYERLFIETYNGGSLLGPFHPLHFYKDAAIAYAVLLGFLFVFCLYRTGSGPTIQEAPPADDTTASGSWPPKPKTETSSRSEPERRGGQMLPNILFFCLVFPVLLPPLLSRVVPQYFQQEYSTGHLDGIMVDYLNIVAYLCSPPILLTLAFCALPVIVHYKLISRSRAFLHRRLTKSAQD